MIDLNNVEMELAIEQNESKLWINVNGKCIVRIQDLKSLTLSSYDPKTGGKYSETYRPENES